MTLFPRPYLLEDGNVQGQQFHPFIVSSINISPTLGLKNMYVKCCLKVSGGVVNEIGKTKTSSTHFLDTCSTNLTCAMATISFTYLILTSLGTTMFPIEKSCGKHDIESIFNFFCQLYVLLALIGILSFKTCCFETWLRVITITLTLIGTLSSLGGLGVVVFKLKSLNPKPLSQMKKEVP